MLKWNTSKDQDNSSIWSQPWRGEFNRRDSTQVKHTAVGWRTTEKHSWAVDMYHSQRQGNRILTPSVNISFLYSFISSLLFTRKGTTITLPSYWVFALSVAGPGEWKSFILDEKLQQKELDSCNMWEATTTMPHIQYCSQRWGRSRKGALKCELWKEQICFH